MTSVSGTTDRSAPAAETGQVWSTRALIAQHKVAAISAVVVLLLLVAFIVGALASSTPIVVSDSSTCTTWSSANQSQQAAYAREYLQEHGSLPGGARTSASVLSAINNGCNDAFDNDVQDDITVVQAIKQQ
jgi:hypothetical protein